MTIPADKPLRAASVVITRPVGQGERLRRKIRRLGGCGILLPGVSLKPASDKAQAMNQLTRALAADIAIFTSPSAAAFARQLMPLASMHAVAATVGHGTERVLQAYGVSGIIVPDKGQHSEGLMAHPALAEIKNKSVAIIGAPGGRGVLHRTVRARGAHLITAHVYARTCAHLDSRHTKAIQELDQNSYILLSSGETLDNIRASLAPSSWQKLTLTTCIASSMRLCQKAAKAGFKHIHTAESALDRDLLATTVVVHSNRSTSA